MKQKELQEKLLNLTKGLNILNKYILNVFRGDGTYISVIMEDIDTISIEDKLELVSLGFQFWANWANRISYEII